jgi:diguanylate cyclase (GGDEF)-like protein
MYREFQDNVRETMANIHSDPRMEKKLQELRVLFCSTLGGKLDELSILSNNIINECNAPDCKRLQFDTHSLRGSASLLGFDALSNALQNIESLSRKLVATAEEHSLSSFEQLFNAMNDLKIAHQDIHKNHSEYFQITANTSNKKLPMESAKTEASIKNIAPKSPPPSTLTNEQGKVSIALIDDDIAVGSMTCKLLLDFNFVIHFYQSLQLAKDGIAKTQIDLVLLDLTMRGTTEQQIFDFGKQLEARNIKTFILTSQDSLNMRLAAVRSNISAFVLKPINITNLVSDIRSTLMLDVVQKFKVCMVDDDATIIKYYKAALEQSGMQVHGLTRPEKLLGNLDDFVPDIFVFDMNMPNINGLELAKIIRQFSKYDSVPILFLSSNIELETKLDILEAGCDDLLPKNMDPKILTRQITARIKRGNGLRFLATCDSMTGLLNHGQIIEAAQQSINLGLRRQSSVIVAMLDLDHFKKVNDTYGHAAGDKVIIGLSQLLLQSVRKTDYIGRYGGEEFLLVFQGGATETVMDKLNHIRETFAQIEFLHGQSKFHVTFSAGLACSGAQQQLTPLLEAADKALYAAKCKGRNCIDS